jgi:hypothetical protein
MAKLTDSFRALAEKFASEILAAVRQASLSEILGEVAGSPPKAAKAAKSAPAARAPKASSSSSKRGRRISAEEILALLKQNKGGMRSEDLRKALGTTKGPMRYQVLKLIEEKRVKMTGTRNSAVYQLR